VFVKAVNEIQKAHVGIEVIIKVIRGMSSHTSMRNVADPLYTASTNPRTSQRALLVTAELARLIPDSVLHNAMPIFTFMGASDFQRDDAYSFGVVEKVSIVVVSCVWKRVTDHQHRRYRVLCR
jgi:U3 small nucleolar RNA-associated protein 10